MSNNSLEKSRKEINEIDRKMAELFVQRMHAAKAVAEYKKENGLAILDEARENEVIQRNSELIEDETLREYYVRFIKSVMSVSRDYQSELTEGDKANG